MAILREYRAEVDAHPDSCEAWSNLGLIERQRGQFRRGARGVRARRNRPYWHVRRTVSARRDAATRASGGRDEGLAWRSASPRPERAARETAVGAAIQESDV